MSMVAELLGRIRGKRQERFQNVADEYEGCVLALASGESVDVDRLAELLDELDKSDSDLEVDVQNKQRRISAAAAIASARAIDAQLPGLRAKMKSLDDSLSAIIAEKRQPIRQLFDQIRALEQQTGALTNEIGVLRTVGVPQSIRQRQAALASRQAEYRELLDEYTSRTEIASSRLAQLKTNVTRLEGGLQNPHEFEDFTLKTMRSQLDEAQAEIPQREAYLRTWDAMKQRLDAMATEIAKESAAIEADLMQP